MTANEIAKLIPPEVVEAAAKCRHDRADADMEHLSHGEFKPRPWETLPAATRSSYFPAARATIAAGLAAWPNAWRPDKFDLYELRNTLVLPLTTKEKQNDR